MEITTPTILIISFKRFFLSPQVIRGTQKYLERIILVVQLKLSITTLQL